MMQAGLVGPWLERWLHRVNVPSLIVWGDSGSADSAGAYRCGLGRADFLDRGC